MFDSLCLIFDLTPSSPGALNEVGSQAPNEFWINVFEREYLNLRHLKV